MFFWVLGIDTVSYTVYQRYACVGCTSGLLLQWRTKCGCTVMAELLSSVQFVTYVG